MVFEVRRVVILGGGKGVVLGVEEGFLRYCVIYGNVYALVVGESGSWIEIEGFISFRGDYFFFIRFIYSFE